MSNPKYVYLCRAVDTMVMLFNSCLTVVYSEKIIEIKLVIYINTVLSSENNTILNKLLYG